ncbi:NAD(P)H-dependent FMN reductase [Lactobacillus colini]|uniref:NAD(P)H-dependent FMN reductase n=1 Tax=Lactobacillus colini TaxID=1819254 RepID=A0ABS4MEP7_9LACO|nr:NAD(P)H-dependent oxidoreductase [Lactobacillus colini]MBP2058161.1 NAD(P)H-dependent FMN reductase [Lactobacillus colini]
MKFLAIVGSNSNDSKQRKLIKFVKNHFSSKYDFETAEVEDLPIFKEGLAEPDNVKALAKKIMSADAVIISTAETQHSVPSSLKSSIEWLSSAEHPFKGKPLMVIGASDTPQGSSRAQVRLKNVLASPGVGAIVFNNDEFMMGNAQQQFDQDGNLPDGTVKFLEHFFTEFDEFYQVVKGYEKVKESE